MSKEFTREIFVRLEMVREDVAAHVLPDKALVLAFVIAQHVNEKSGNGWPGQARLAMLIGASTRTVRSLMKRLIERGHFEVSSHDHPDGDFRTRSRYKTIRYRFANRKPASALDGTSNRKPASALDETKPEVSRRQTGSFAQAKRKFDVVKPEASFRQTTSEPLQELSQRAQAREPRADARLCVTDEEKEKRMWEPIRAAYNEFASIWGGAAGWPKEENREALEIFVRLVKSRRGMAQEIMDKAHGLKAPLPRPAAFLREIEHPRLKLAPTNGAATKFDDGPMRCGGFRCKDRQWPVH